MKTRITELFGIEHPVVLSGMSWISTPRLVAAVSNAGGLGILATGVFNPDQTRKAIREVRELTGRPFGANATLYFPGARENAQVLLEEKVPVINFSMGKGDWIVEGAHRYGGKVLATVTTAKHAVSAASYGTDAVLVTGNEAAGHGAGVSSLVLVQRIREAVDLPLVAAGGFSTGRALLAALVLGADGIAMGTRFMNTKESPAHEACKEASRRAEAEETLYTTRFDGQPCRILLSEGGRKAVKRGLDLKRAAFNGVEISRMLGVPYPKMVLSILAQGWKTTLQLAHLANAFKGFRLSCTEGDLKRGVLPLGQTTALIHDTPSVEEVITRIVREAEEAARSLPSRL